MWRLPFLAYLLTFAHARVPSPTRFATTSQVKKHGLGATAYMGGSEITRLTESIVSNASEAKKTLKLDDSYNGQRNKNAAKANGVSISSYDNDERTIVCVQPNQSYQDTYDAPSK